MLGHAPTKDLCNACSAGDTRCCAAGTGASDSAGSSGGPDGPGEDRLARLWARVTPLLRAGLGARTVAATLLDATADETVAALRAYEGVSDLRIDAGRLTLRSADSDAVAGILLAAGARNLEIAAPTLETAFTALTED